VSGRPKGSCFTCSHPERQAIDEAVLRGESYREIGERYGISKSAVSAHGKRHVARDDERAALISLGDFDRQARKP
jgi:DNA-directed RNA polymerase specialized sigma24 family protein